MEGTSHTYAAPKVDVMAIRRTWCEPANVQTTCHDVHTRPAHGNEHSAEDSKTAQLSSSICPARSHDYKITVDENDYKMNVPRSGIRQLYVATIVHAVGLVAENDFALAREML